MHIHEKKTMYINVFYTGFYFSFIQVHIFLQFFDKISNSCGYKYLAIDISSSVIVDDMGEQNRNSFVS